MPLTSSHSQETRILKFLKSGHTLTSLEALRMFGTLRLSARILELRKRYNIKSTLVSVNGKRVAEYSL